MSSSALDHDILKQFFFQSTTVNKTNQIKAGTPAKTDIAYLHFIYYFMCQPAESVWVESLGNILASLSVVHVVISSRQHSDLVSG